MVPGQGRASGPRGAGTAESGDRDAGDLHGADGRGAPEAVAARQRDVVPTESGALKRTIGPDADDARPSN